MDGVQLTTNLAAGAARRVNVRIAESGLDGLYHAGKSFVRTLIRRIDAL